MLTKKLTYLLYGLLACHASPALTQTDSLLLRNYQSVKTADSWLTSSNAAALTRFSATNIAEAELSLSYGKGELTDFYDSPKVLQAGAAIESFYRLSRRTVVYGAISYDNWTGRDMTGSAFMHLPSRSSRYPFDIVEDSLTNAGRKHRDTYQLTGAVGVDVWRGYALGARVAYTAANYAKYKDLRHKNKLMDLSASVSAYAPLLPWLSLGANYTYHRQTESIDFGTYGKSEKVYKSLIDYGAFMGRVEQFGNEGFTDKSREMPLFEDSHGGGFQLSLHPVEQLTALASFSFANGNGYYGRRSPYTITYTQHRREQRTTALSLIYTPSSRTSKYHLDVSYSNERLANRAETFRELTNETSATYYEYYDPTEMGDKQWDDISATATALLGLRGEMPTWKLTASYQWTKRQQIAYLFPYYRLQKLTAGEASIRAQYNLIRTAGVWSFTLEGAFKQGSGQPYEDGYLVGTGMGDEPETAMNYQKNGDSMDAFLMREYRFFTAPQYKIGASVQYAFLLPGTRLKTHIGGRIEYRKANESNTYCLGDSHTRLSLSIGCLF